MLKLENGKEIIAADYATLILEGEVSAEYFGARKTIEVELPEVLVTKLQAVAQCSGASRSYIVNILLEVGIDEVCKRLSAKTSAKLEKIEKELYSDMR